MKRTTHAPCAAIAALFLSVVAGSAAELRVFAAASLSDALREIAPLHAKATGDTLVFNFGASGALARQIKEGAPADVIVSADELRVDQLAAGGLLLADTRRILVENTLVLVVAAEDGVALTTLSDLGGPAVRRLAIGEPATVPAGTYAKAHLEKLGLWTAVQPKTVPLDNVRAVLAAVEAGNADAGFVYRTDALVSKKVRLAVEVPRAEGPRIVYPAAVVQASPSPQAARALVAFLGDAEAQAVFAKFGFLAPN